MEKLRWGSRVSAGSQRGSINSQDSKRASRENSPGRSGRAAPAAVVLAKLSVARGIQLLPV